MPLNTIDELARQSVDRCLSSISQRFKLNTSEFEHTFTDTYRSLPPSNQNPFPGVREVCIYICEHGGVNIAVTHRKPTSTQTLLEAHNLSSLFTDIYSSEQGYPRKPDPAMVLAAMQRYKLSSGDTLLVGDRDLDIQAGRAAGLQTCLFGCEPLSQPASFQIDAYIQLLQCLNAQNGAKPAQSN